MFAMTVTVKTIDNQRWIRRIHELQFITTSCEDEQAHPSTRSRDPREQLDQPATHPLPAVARAAERLLLVALEARLHERQARSRRDGSERERHDRVEERHAPRVAELLERLDLEHAAAHGAVPSRM